MPAQEAWQLLNNDSYNLIPLNGRTPGKYATAHLQNAKNIDFLGQAFQEKIRCLDRKKAFLVYCHSGRRSEAASSLLRKAGFEKVYDLKGGIRAWQEAKLPLVQAGAK